MICLGNIIPLSIDEKSCDQFVCINLLTEAPCGERSKRLLNRTNLSAMG